MPKKEYIVTLTEEERHHISELTRIGFILQILSDLVLVGSVGIRRAGTAT